MKILLDVKKDSHKIYQELYKYPPVKYVTDFSYNNPIFRVVNKSINVSFYKNKGRVCHIFKRADLVHSVGRIVLNNVNYVVDLEHPIILTPNQRDYRFLVNSGVRNFITMQLKKEKCKFILPFTESAKKEFQKYFHDKELENKLEVVYPAHHSVGKIRIVNKEKIKLLFVGTKFHAKGGKEALEVFEKLNKKYDVELFFVSETPPEYIQKYSSYQNIHFLHDIPWDELETLYRTSDAFIFPLFQASFGVYLEALAYQVPVVTTDVFDIPEIIEDNKTGLNVHSPISLYGEGFISKWKTFNDFNEILKKTHFPEFVEEFAESVENLITNKKIQNRIRRNCYKVIECGKFSIKERNKKLKEIYSMACDNV